MGLSGIWSRDELRLVGLVQMTIDNGGGTVIHEEAFELSRVNQVKSPRGRKSPRGKHSGPDADGTTTLWRGVHTVAQMPVAGSVPPHFCHKLTFEVELTTSIDEDAQWKVLLS